MLNNLSVDGLLAVGGWCSLNKPKLSKSLEKLQSSENENFLSSDFSPSNDQNKKENRHTILLIRLEFQSINTDKHQQFKEL